MLVIPAKAGIQRSLDSRPDFRWMIKGKSGQSVRSDSPAALPQGRFRGLK